MVAPPRGSRWRNPVTKATAEVLDFPDDGGHFSIAVSHFGWPDKEGEWVRVADFVAEYSEELAP